MDITLRNTLSGEKERLTPLHPGKVSMYNCGPTVYSSPHIGNLRAYIFADTLRKTLEYAGLAVTQVINITDVGHLTGDGDIGEDKMEAGARRAGMTAHEIALRYTDEFMRDLRALNIDTERIVFPKATEHIPEQIALIRTLEEKGYAYRTPDGIYFDTARFPRYGALARLNTQELREGARVEKNPHKRNPADFALWKFSLQGEKRQQEWDSPWGIGFPGWHIECSAMAMKYLGEHFDIHTGGVDHIPVHHTNEIAQSEAATEKPFVSIWMHSAFLTAGEKKMAKSEGNFITLPELAKKFSPLAFRLWLYSGHYSTPMRFTWGALEGAAHALQKLYAHAEEWGESALAPDVAYQDRFAQLIADDLDMPKAVALLWDAVKDSSLSPAVKKATILDMDRVLSIGITEAARPASPDIPPEIAALLAERTRAREQKNWSTSDEIRRNLEARGYHIVDTDHGSVVRASPPKKS